MSDTGALPELSGFVWCLIALAVFGGVVAMLNYLASCIRNQQIVHDLKLEINHLQSTYIKRLREQKERSVELQPVSDHKKAA